MTKIYRNHILIYYLPPTIALYNYEKIQISNLLSRIVFMTIQIAEPLRRLFRSQITLSLGQQFKAHHELPDGCRSQQRWIINRMQRPPIIGLCIGRICGSGCPMPPHRVREGAVEQIVVLCRQLLNHQSEIFLLPLRQLGDSLCRCVTCNQHRLVWPGRPEWNHHQPILILNHHPFLLPDLLVHIIAQQRSLAYLVVLPQMLILQRRMAGQERTGPDLTMRMRITAAHRRALVLENLNPQVLLRQVIVLLNPPGNHSSNLLGTHHGQRLIRFRVEAHDTAIALRRSNLEEGVCIGNLWIGNVFQQSREIVGEHKGRLVVGVYLEGKAKFM